MGILYHVADEKISLTEIKEAIESGLPIPKAWSVPANGLSL